MKDHRNQAVDNALIIRLEKFDLKLTQENPVKLYFRPIILNPL